MTSEKSPYMATTTPTPTVTAIPIATTVASVVRSIHLDILPFESSYISFVGNPPRVSQVLQLPPALQGREVELTGYYFHAVKINGNDLEISNITTDQQLRQILLHFQHLPRQIILSDHAPLPVLNHEGTSCTGNIYKHMLPTNVSLQVDFDGFPAKVKAVAPTSIMSDRMIQPDQCVEGVYVSGQEPLTPLVPGFTGHRVQQHLEATQNTPNRILILIDDPNPNQDHGRKKKGSTPLFDWGGFRRW